MSDKPRILMCAIPSGDRGPASGYGRHLAALSKDFYVEEISHSLLQNEDKMSNFDVFWFYVRFDPQLYLYLQRKYSKKIFWVGPNVLFEKAEIGPSDPWEIAFTSQAKSTLYCNVAQYYLERVGQFYQGASLMRELPYCIDSSEYSSFSSIMPLANRSIDVLVYSKKRRIDRQFDDLFPQFMELLKNRGLNVHVITYGKYSRNEYLQIASNSKCCVWFSIEDYCSNAQLEAMLMGCPIVGTPYNLTHTFDREFLIDGHDMSNEKWLSWKFNLPELYSAGVDKILCNLDRIEGLPRQYVMSSHSYAVYSDLVFKYIQEAKSL